MGDLKKTRLKDDIMVKIQIQLRHSIFIIIICHDVEGHEKRGEYIRQQIQCISSYLIGKLVAVLQFMQVINNSTMV